MAVEVYTSQVFIITGDAKIDTCYMLDGTSLQIADGRCRYLGRVAITDNQFTDWVQGVDFGIKSPTYAMHGRPSGCTIGRRDSYDGLISTFVRPPSKPADHIQRCLSNLLEYFPNHRANVSVTILSEFCPRFDIGAARPNLSRTYMPVLEQVCKEVTAHLHSARD